MSTTCLKRIQTGAEATIDWESCAEKAPVWTSSQVIHWQYPQLFTARTGRTASVIFQQLKNVCQRTIPFNSEGSQSVIHIIIRFRKSAHAFWKYAAFYFFSVRQCSGTSCTGFRAQECRYWTGLHAGLSLKMWSSVLFCFSQIVS